MLLNKWLRFAMSAAMGLTGLAMAMDWSSILSPGTAGKIIGVLGTIKMIEAYLAPAAGMSAQPTGNSIVTHN